ncbi:putative bifunctional diguanylate cyclase/phosphodiesterase [Paractinoplanes durhamensis]|uniref:Two-component system response regulator n=1 Tax=Paractinoplanes durhamensis TaxID=113563 RepID=A0ABQ3YXC5_9ACTN|nr:EAL domain-containing protein [Actinoplanes durhamensis]GIE02221.1 two-component system response regulator [Actinoplanes durhamensis]
MRRLEVDDHTADYWVRQIRIGTAIAALGTLIGAIRVALSWDAGSRWWLVPVFAAVAVQIAAIKLPWRRLVRSKLIRRRLLLWWFAEVPILVLFAIADPAGMMVYLPGALLLLITMAALYTPRTVLVFGGLCVLCYVVLLPWQTGAGPATTFFLGGEFATLVGLTAINAQSRRRLESRRRVTEQRAETLLEASADTVLAVGRDGTLKYVSGSIKQLLGFDAAELTGSRVAQVMTADRLGELHDFMNRMLNLPIGQSLRVESRLRNAAGEWVYVDVMGTNWINNPDLQAVVVSLRDIGARRELEQQLSRQAFTDSLTGMPNRVRFRQQLEEAVGDGGEAPVTVLLLDLDDFKLVNDNLGHSAGDELLTTIAERLRAQVRPDDVLARLGGDEFAILLRDLDPADASGLAERLLAAAREPIRLGSRDVTCSLSIGIATLTGMEPDTAGMVAAEQLLGNADLAMYAAKRAGRNAYAIFDPTMTMSVLEEAQQRADIEHALEHEEFLVLYQPVVDMHTQRLTAVEALVRWQHPRDGLLGPYHFIAGAEANGLIVPLGRWVLRQACAQLAQWRAESPAAAGLHVNVNLSARQFQYAGLVDDVAAALADAGLDAASLTLEITESMLMADIETAKDTLHALRRLGVRLAIDDFGTGYSSLSYLKQLPVDVIKIDKTFVDEVHIDEDDVALVDAVAGLGAALKMQTVAEGIETDEQWATLRRLGIDHGQGYLFGRPAEPADIAGMLAANRTADLAGA